MRSWMLPLLLLLTSCGPRWEPASDTVHVFVPIDAETQGTHVPVLYLEKGHALFFPEGVGGRSRPVEPRPSELVALGQRKDIVIIAVDSVTGPRAEDLGDGRTRYITHPGGS
ncbi:hypothetical protein HUW62_20270 [Myxococcus sp. AM011]|uniref:hypothetical protein n=1 Tax=Myxococcus sp. AM011 TaxID=2745200 RepID=UPI00159519F3|nr:hypothetical protein [Myxococcus sp. AM011]NVJ23564.1 hypothetical protein [Myxococcus sp. AM011]